MTTIERNSGVKIEVDAGVQLVDADRPPVATRRRGPLPAGPVTMNSNVQGADALVDALTREKMTLLDSFELATGAGGAVRGAAPPARLSVEVAVDESAVVLLEYEGIYSWAFPGRVALQQPSRRGPVLEPARKMIEIDIAVAPPVDPTARTRGLVEDLVIGRIRAFVLRFAARVVGQQTMKFLERERREGFVVMEGGPADWRRVETARELGLPSDRPARILLFVHGALIGTAGTFCALGASDWGRAFLARARMSYDAVVGYEHRTLGTDPLENASDLLARLEAARLPHAPVMDVVTFSRGALVVRSLVETLMPSSSFGARISRVIFVGGPHAGTPLADPGRWESFLDLYTNLASIGTRALTLLAPSVPAVAFQEAVTSIGAFVKYLASVALDERVAPGLAAMTPGGAFIRRLNELQPDQPGPAESHYCVVTSSFDGQLFSREGGAPELPKRLGLWLVDRVADAFVGQPNDLVVDTASMAAIDVEHGAFVEDRLDLGPNAHVYHLGYFARPEVVAALARWLDLERAPEGVAPSPEVRVRLRAEQAGTPLPAAAETDLLVVKASAPAAEVMAEVRARAPAFVVVERHRGLIYAYRPEELLTLGSPAEGGPSLEEALRRIPDLEMHEHTRSPQVALGARPLAYNRAITAGTAARVVLMEGETPLAVLDRRPKLAAPGGGEENRHAAWLKRLSGARRANGGTPGRRRGQPPGSGQEGVPEAISPSPAEQPARGACHLSASMPESLVIGQQYSVTVVVSREVLEQLTGPTAASAAMTIDYRQALMVQAIGRENVRVVGESRVSVDPRQLAPSITLLFDVEGTNPGPAELWVLVRQGPLAIATLTLKPRVVVEAPATALPVRAAARVELPDAEAAVYPVLQILEVKHGDELRYQFLLTLDDGSAHEAVSEPLKTDRVAYVNAIYKRIEERWLGSHRDVVEFGKQLREYGGQLFDELVPPAIQAPLWEVRDRIQAIKVYSAEPFIPWELVHLKPPRQAGQSPARLPAQSMFLAERGLVRWLHGVKAPARAVEIRDRRAFYVVPDYPHQDWALPAAQREIPFLRDRLGAQPLAGTPEAVREFLERGDFDLLHFAGHGLAELSGEAKVMLLGRVEGNRYVPEYLEARTVDQSANLDERRPIVVLNACQIGRAGWQLTSIGGFAAAFLRAGAGAFVGTLWSVGDEPAQSFTGGFYTALIEGKTLAQAAAAARTVAREAGEATWLAYAVYGGPNAQLTLEG